METPICPACGCSLVRLGISKKKAVQHNHAGKQYWFCCKGCLELFITDPDSCLAETSGLTVCPVCLAEKPVNATVTIGFNGKTVGFCRCPHCLEVFNKDPHYFIARLAWQTDYAGVFGENMGCCSQ